MQTQHRPGGLPGAGPDAVAPRTVRALVVRRQAAGATRGRAAGAGRAGGVWRLRFSAGLPGGRAGRRPGGRAASGADRARMAAARSGDAARAGLLRPGGVAPAPGPAVRAGARKAGQRRTRPAAGVRLWHAGVALLDEDFSGQRQRCPAPARRGIVSPAPCAAAARSRSMPGAVTSSRQKARRWRWTDLPPTSICRALARP